MKLWRLFVETARILPDQGTDRAARSAGRVGREALVHVLQVRVFSAAGVFVLHFSRILFYGEVIFPHDNSLEVGLSEKPNGTARFQSEVLR